MNTLRNVLGGIARFAEAHDRGFSDYYFDKWMNFVVVTSAIYVGNVLVRMTF